MDMRVPEIQSTMLQCLYQQNNNLINFHSLFDLQQPLSAHFKPDHHHQCNSAFVQKQASVSPSIKKRKAEFDVEEEISGITTKTDRETSTKMTCSKETSRNKPDYIHVRARRGQATDSHSLAERARREKIGKKMKCLQDLVPGCNKVTGKAGMLDEIINYVQSLQKQVEFLSMKLAASNPRLDYSIYNFSAKEATNSTCLQYTSTGVTHAQMGQSEMIHQMTGIYSFPFSEGFPDSSSIPQFQQLPVWDSEWPSLFSGSFHQ